MFSCCAIALAYITQNPAVCYASMSLPVQQFVLHIPRLHHIVRGMMLIGLKVWKSPLFYPRGSLSLKCTHTITYTCASRNQHQETQYSMKSWFWRQCSVCDQKIQNVPKWITVYTVVKYVTLFHCFRFSVDTKWLFTCCRKHKLCTSEKRDVQCVLHALHSFFLTIYYSVGGKQDVFSISPLPPPHLTPCHMTLKWHHSGFSTNYYLMRDKRDRTKLISQTSRHTSLKEHYAPAV